MVKFKESCIPIGDNGRNKEPIFRVLSILKSNKI